MAVLRGVAVSYERGTPVQGMVPVELLGEARAGVLFRPPAIAAPVEGERCVVSS